MTSATDTREKLLEDLSGEISKWRSYDGNFMRIYSFVVYAYVKELLDRQAEIVKREYDETHMELPVDADGLPIRVGDVVDSGLDGGKVLWLELWADGWVVVFDVGRGNTSRYESTALRHAKPRTLEDVLREFGNEVWEASCTCQTSWSDSGLDGIEERYANEIRELLEVDE